MCWVGRRLEANVPASWKRALEPLTLQLRRWHSESATPAVLTAVVLVATVFLLQALSGFGAEAGLLYAIPVWFAARFAGRAAGSAVAFAAGLCWTAAVSIKGGHHIVLTGALALAPLLGLAIVVSQVEDPVMRLRRMALQDPLTGLLNRRSLEELGLVRSRVHHDYTVVMIDCDGFKSINDRFGHQAGDHILKMLARILRNETRACDLAIRMGGDEFALVLEGVSSEETRHILDRVKDNFERQVKDAGYECSISAGIAETDPALELEEMLRRADEAMYRNKSRRSTIAPML